VSASAGAGAGAGVNMGPRGTAARQWRRARHSLRARLTGLFLLLALAMTLTFVAGMQGALRFGWQDYARPLIADYIDSLTAQIGTPPDVSKAQAIASRLPLRIRIDGPAVNWSSQPDARDDEHPRRASVRPRAHR